MAKNANHTISFNANHTISRYRSKTAQDCNSLSVFSAGFERLEKKTLKPPKSCFKKLLKNRLSFARFLNRLLA